MKKLTLTLFILFSVAAILSARVSNPVVMPDIPGYKTLKFDFHIHTAFSDGNVWPTTRVAEARYEGMEGLSITDHLDTRLQKMILKFPSDSIDRNSSWKVASAKADPGSGWGCNEGRIRPMPITISNMQTKDGKLVFYASEAEITDDSIENGYFGCAGVAKIDNLQDKLVTLAKGGFKHHTSICEGHFKDVLKEAFTNYLHYDWVEID